MTDANISRIALSLWTSTKTVEKLPRIVVYEPTETVWLTYTVETYRAGDYL